MRSIVPEINICPKHQKIVIASISLFFKPHSLQFRFEFCGLDHTHDDLAIAEYFTIDPLDPGIRQYGMLNTRGILTRLSDHRSISPYSLHVLHVFLSMKGPNHKIIQIYAPWLLFQIMTGVSFLPRLSNP